MHCVVYVTAPTSEEGERLARGLVEGKLAACVNVVKGIRSIYRWRGEVEEADEVLLVAKTREDLVDRLAAWVKANHTYTIPEVVALPIVAGHDPYLRWIDESVGEAVS